nr:PREDICTED: protein D2-like [Bemisia tabaci]
MIETFSIILPFVLLSLQLQVAMSKERLFNPVILSNMLYKEKIIPDVIQYPPCHLLQLRWEDNVTAELGNNLFKYEVFHEPTLYWPHEENLFYTIIFVAPDMPDPNNCTQREYQCWVVVNIPGIQVEHGQVLTDYIPPPTPLAYGSQRYVFLVYIQPKGNVSFSEDYLPPVPNDMVRQNFSTAKFTKKYAYGVPFAANWFRINWGSFNRS